MQTFQTQKRRNSLAVSGVLQAMRFLGLTSPRSLELMVTLTLRNSELSETHGGCSTRSFDVSPAWRETLRSCQCINHRVSPRSLPKRPFALPQRTHTLSAQPSSMQNAAKVSFEPFLPTFCNAANVGYRWCVENVPELLRFWKGVFDSGNRGVLRMCQKRPFLTIAY